MSDLRLPGLVWLGLAAAAAMLIGSFGPWGKAIGLVNVSISGTDGSNDGWLVVGAAVFGAAALLAYSRGGKLGAFGAVLAGVGGAAVTIYDRQNVTHAAGKGGSDYVALQVGWGLNLALGASILLGIVGLVALLGNPHAPGMAKPVDSMELAPQPTLPDAHTKTPEGDPAEHLKQLAELRDAGIVTDDEFVAKKVELLARM